MTTRILPSALVAISLVFGVAACGDDDAQQQSPQSDGSLPPVVDGIEHPTGADEIVVSYAEVGGFVPREFAFQQTPSVLLSGDGRSFSPGAQIEIYPGPLVPAVQSQTISEAGIQEVLAAADEAGLLREVEYDAPTNIADASTAVVVIAANGQTYVHEAYALGMAAPGAAAEESSPERQALADFIAQLSDLQALVGADELGEQQLLEPETYGIEGVVVDDLSAYASDGIEPTLADWPADASVRLADATACTPIAATEVGSLFADANQLTFFVDDDVTYQVLVRPILPGDDCA